MEGPRDRLGLTHDTLTVTRGGAPPSLVPAQDHLARAP